jgi:PAS domain S-box-containing protein
MNELLNRIREEIINIIDEIKEREKGKKYIVIKCEHKGDDVICSICPEIPERLITCRKFNLDESCLIYNLASLSDIFWELDLITYKISYSKECLRLAGYSPEEVEGTLEEWISSIHPEDATGVLENLEAHTKGDIPVFNAEYRARCKDGTYRWILDRGKVVSWDKDGNPVKMIGMFIDFSLQKKLENSLLKTVNREKELNELKTQFVSMASHEFRTPLSTMLMSVEALLSYRDKMTDEEIDKKVRRIKKEIYSSPKHPNKRL